MLRFLPSGTAGASTAASNLNCSILLRLHTFTMRQLPVSDTPSSFRRSALLLLLLLALHSSVLLAVHAQYPFLVPASCTAKRLDLASLACVDCPTNSSPDPNDQNRCKCDQGYMSVAGTTDIYSFTCVDCTQFNKAASQDRSQCLPCALPAVLNNSTKECVCPSGEALGQFECICSRVDLNLLDADYCIETC
jgi:hypothetical protein